MAVPKKKISSSRRGKRRSHHALNNIKVIECPNCGAESLPHHLCASCGYYNEKPIIRVKKIDDKEDSKIGHNTRGG